MSTPTPRWDDIGKLKDQNSQLRLWIEQQRRYIKALLRAVPPSLIEDLATTLPPRPDIPETLTLWEPKRILDSPIDDSPAFGVSFPVKPRLPPRDSSTTSINMMSTASTDNIQEGANDNDILDHYPASTSDDKNAKVGKIEEHEMVYLAYEMSKDGNSSIKSSPTKKGSFISIDSSSNLQKLNGATEKEDCDFRVKVLHTTRALTPKGKEAMALILSVVDVVKNEEIWKLDKQYSHLAILDVYVSLCYESYLKLRKKDPVENFPPLPEKYLFQTFCPYKFDTRKNEVESYINIILSRYGNWKEVRNFIRTNKYEHIKSPYVMEGFLFRTEKHGGSWKARYYYIKDGSLACSERVGEPQISSIDLRNLTVSRFTDLLSPSENDHCHAFILYEFKSSSTDINQEKQRLVFSCDSDKDRDLWVLHLGNEILKFRPKELLSKELSDVSFKDNIPRRSSSKELSDTKTLTKVESPLIMAGISPIADIVGEIRLPLLRNKSENSETKSTMGKYFKSKTSIISTEKPLPQTKRIFGSPLNDAIEISQISKNLPIPAVVIVLAKDLVWEDEGIYRLSGKSTEINYLKGKYESELDFDLINQEEMFDTNAVAGLLKLYLRELPSPLLPESEKPNEGKTNLEFCQIALSKIPYLNYALLKTIFRHLALIASHSSVNKMSPQNLSIIFSPTLQLSPLTFSVFLEDYATVFSREELVRSAENS